VLQTAVSDFETGISGTDYISFGQTDSLVKPRFSDRITPHTTIEKLSRREKQLKNQGKKAGIRF
jgi:hypothetical protein